MTKWSVRVRRGPRDPELLPRGSDDALGEAVLARLVDTTRKAGPPRPALVALTEAYSGEADAPA